MEFSKDVDENGRHQWEKMCSGNNMEQTESKGKKKKSDIRVVKNTEVKKPKRKEKLSCEKPHAWGGREGMSEQEGIKQSLK